MPVETAHLIRKNNPSDGQALGKRDFEWISLRA
jgi:hypothetical protein